MKSLNELDLGGNWFNGSIPPALGSLPSLQLLDLSDNQLSGVLPQELGHLKNLKYLWLINNNFIGELPQSLAALRKMVNLHVSDLTGSSEGEVPFPDISGMTSLKWMDLSFNNLSGEIPAFMDSRNLQYLYLKANKLNGSVPGWLAGSKTSYADISENNFTTIPVQLGGKALNVNSFACCAETANLSMAWQRSDYYCPTDKSLKIMYSENKDPSSKGKRLFDVAIQGKKVLENFNIREAAMGVNKSVSLDFIATVRNHQLEIHFYWTGKGSIRNPMEYYGPLISAISVFPVPRKPSTKLSPMSIAALVGSAFLLPLLLLVFICKLGILGGKELHNKELKGLELQPGGSFNFRQIKAATRNFNPVNKIGEGGFGSVYKGVLPNGTAIAVKQLSSKSKQGTREFVNEVGTIFALQHPNLVKLLGCCTEDNQLLLVYEYMENNSLAHALFGSEKIRLKLNWPIRFKICLGIAKGLAFLHEESKLKVVHRDIKPTNVLLDKDLNAKISDFGLAKLYEAEKTHVITRIAGTTGYMAPEYAMRGYLTNKADVYSFGVVALEIVSGKNGTSYRPNDESVYLLDLAYVLQEKGELLSLVDPMLGYDYSVKQALMILDLAMVCTNPSPTLRPTMSEVVKVLEGKSKIKAPSFHVPYSTDDFAMAKAVASLIPRIRSGSNSTGKTSNAVTYDVVSRDEDEYGIYEDCSSEMLEKTDSLVNDFSGQRLRGGIPPETANLQYLTTLDLSDNQLSGVLPYELGHLINLEYLWLINNNFIGELPQSLAALKKMINLFIFGNNFSGRIPDYIAKWENLKYLGLIGNSFEGAFPEALSSLSLSELHVSDLTGSSEGRGFPFPDISGMTSLEWMRTNEPNPARYHPVYGGGGWSVPSVVAEDVVFEMRQQWCNLKANGMDNVDKSDVTVSVILEVVAQAKCQWLTMVKFFCLRKAAIISYLIFRRDLKFVFIAVTYLKGNKLNGSIPTWLAGSKTLHADISENNFTSVSIQPEGIAPNVNSFACCAETANLSTAWQRVDYYCPIDKSLNDHLYINCGGEGVLINGVHYQADTQPDGGSTFFLSDDTSWGYSSEGIFMGTGHEQYILKKSCGIPSDYAPLYKTARVSPISLKYYGFCMKNEKYIVKLHFAEIMYGENKDPSSKGKRLFDVAIQGKKVFENFNIRESAMGVNKNVTLDFIATVRNHRLEIHLYWTGKGSIRTPMEYYGPLISAISVFPGTIVPRKPGTKLSPMIIAALIGSALLLPLLILVFMRKQGFLGGKDLHSKELKGLELQPGVSLNFRQIKAATQNFNPVNKIGEGGFGSVYKGVLPNGTAIAVKQLSSKSKQGTREFVNEVGTIFALQHPNLAKLLGCCAEDNQLLLVYEYMENNSLAHVLFGSEELRLKLNWPIRFKICLGIAKGLAFLHEESKLKVVHRDIKPTNVLLDKDLNAKISDFGLAKLYEAEKTHVITRIAGTTGYMAPEYAMRGYLTNKADVYSFGVVALEVMSGKNSTSYRPNDESVYLLDLAYVLQEKGELLSLVDPVLGYDYSVKQAMMILDLAMLCSNPSPTLRPTMSEVVKVLEGQSKIIKAPSFRVRCSD
ncbi:hypothetical protein GH714_004244 [Hevea brasiliensis]|uniref:non-specific serine/threonine protein kinase n=1 Tax=Hevea brasiliensis TaxID=3981 RepID=A0A6A6LXX3_HEVBR|nr:hypothetical protein GH714_004244 [Hevea brasiliensis]